MCLWHLRQQNWSDKVYLELSSILNHWHPCVTKSETNMIAFTMWMMESFQSKSQICQGLYRELQIRCLNGTLLATVKRCVVVRSQFLAQFGSDLFTYPNCPNYQQHWLISSDLCVLIITFSDVKQRFWT